MTIYIAYLTYIELDIYFSSGFILSLEIPTIIRDGSGDIFAEQRGYSRNLTMKLEDLR